MRAPCYRQLATTSVGLGEANAELVKLAAAFAEDPGASGGDAVIGKLLKFGEKLDLQPAIPCRGACCCGGAAELAGVRSPIDSWSVNIGDWLHFVQNVQ